MIACHSSEGLQSSNLLSTFNYLHLFYHRIIRLHNSHPPSHLPTLGMMLPSSVRRVVSAAPQSSLFSSLGHTTARTPAAFLVCNPNSLQRRRYSSSKPSSPNDSPKGISDGQVTASPSQPTKQPGEKRRRKTKEINDLQKLPSVPSTQHVPQEGSCKMHYYALFAIKNASPCIDFINSSSLVDLLLAASAHVCNPQLPENDHR